VLVLAALAHPASRLGPLVGCRPLRWIGERSYGIYLWHFPIIILTTPEGAEGSSTLRSALQLAATIGVAALSWQYIENPIRHGALKRLRGPQTITRRGWAAIATSGFVIVVALAGMAGVGASDELPGDVAVATTLTTGGPELTGDRASCDSVVHIGDSTSEGLISADYLPKPKQRISHAYARVGATTQHFEISGARSIYETFEGQPNAFDVATAWTARGFDGCWVFALGTNESANVAAGSAVGFVERIDTMMGVTRLDPTLWVNVKTVDATGPYAAENMERWNEALLAACDRYPTMRIYDWASDVKDRWFIPDGIHFTTQGYAARARLIADALFEAFPAGVEIAETDSTSCLVHPDGDPDTPGEAAPEVAEASG
jgi:hypothetical protein